MLVHMVDRGRHDQAWPAPVQKAVSVRLNPLHIESKWIGNIANLG